MKKIFCFWILRGIAKFAGVCIRDAKNEATLVRAKKVTERILKLTAWPWKKGLGRVYPLAYSLV